MIWEAVGGSVRYLFCWPHWLVVIAQRQVDDFRWPLLAGTWCCGWLSRRQWGCAKRGWCWCGFSLDSLDAVVSDLDKVIVAFVIMAVLTGLHVLFGRPFSAWLDGDLIRVSSCVQDLFNVLIDGKRLVGYGFAAYRTRPCWRLFLELEERVGIKTLVVGAYSRPAGSDDAQSGDGVLERHDTRPYLDIRVIGVFHHYLQVSGPVVSHG